MTKIKICGLMGRDDVEAVNRARPDYCGFVIHVPKSRRNLEPDAVRRLRAGLSDAVIPVGVFVDAPMEMIVSLVRDQTIGMVQLHGQEGDGYLRELREAISVPVIRAVRADSIQSVEAGEKSRADYVLFDQGNGGTGRTFDWRLLQKVKREYFLAGGIGLSNLEEAMRIAEPYAVDISSGVETEGKKDPGKIWEAVRIVRRGL